MLIKKRICHTYIYNFIGEGSKLIFDILKIKYILESYLLWIDIEKAFASVECYFELNRTFLRWFETLKNRNPV